MQKVYSKKASITVFLTLLLLLSASFFFALLETARLKGLGTKADIVSDAALESVFAEYQKEIYENYGLLMLDCAYGSGNFAIENVEKRLQEKNLNNLKQSEKELYGINLTECKMTGYQLLTDDGGNVFRHLAARTAKEEALVQEVDDFAERYSKRKLRAGKWNGRRTFRRGKQNNRWKWNRRNRQKIQKRKWGIFPLRNHKKR